MAQCGANLSIDNGVFPSGYVFTTAVSGFLIGGATAPAAGYAASFAGGLLLDSTSSP